MNTATSLLHAAIPEFLGSLAASAVLAISLWSCRRGREALARKRATASTNTVP
ncbi:hypothetical protein OG974_30240 (plasmid) [Streptomyces sp. NBC_00597]|uniref:hypothetical protein n=1 Tax=unclassified Streptomyces TaxID=2593676 RepID=UPI002E15E20E|nr:MULTISPECIES: hypothetical protein [unclassified Streptomyces]WSR28841.1 hypothetical protein OG573_40240 [Streptomyces sp. NBC_01205]